jgi:hypothetical protein
MRASMKNAASPEAYLDALSGWQLAHASTLRRLVKRAAKLDERMKWGHLVYAANGPVCLIRAEPARVLFGFWRGQRLRAIEPRLKPGGKYEMATLTLDASAALDPKVVRRLVVEAVALNVALGDPTDLSAPSATEKPPVTPPVSSRATKGGARRSRRAGGSSA